MWLEHHLCHHPDADFMFTDAHLSPDASDEEHAQFTKTISNTYQNQIVKATWNKAKFKNIYKGPDKHPLGIHSKQKMAATLAKKCGSPLYYIDHRRRWVVKKGSAIVIGVYIDPEDIYVDANIASNLCNSGPVKYKVKEGLEHLVTMEWLAENIVP
jgi:hypothetical protein